MTADDDEAGQISDSEDSVMQQIKMKVVRRAAAQAGMCAHLGDDDYDDDDSEDNDNDDGAEEEEEEDESSEYASSPDSASNSATAVMDQAATPKSCRRRHGENLNSDEEGTPKHKRSKSDADSRRVQSQDGSEDNGNGSKEADTVTKLLGTELAAVSESGQSVAADQDQLKSSASLQDNMPTAQVFCAKFGNTQCRKEDTVS